MTEPSAELAARRAGPPLLIDLALQGGGSHGAFTWACWTAYWKRAG
jgi:NTE family protein